MRFPALVALALGAGSLGAAHLCAQSGPAQSGPTESGPSWDYEGKHGALAWSHLDPAWKVCSAGHEQAPIDIRNARLNKALQPIEFHYIGGPITLENDGHTVIAHVDPGSYIVAGGERYALTGFDFHHPSEEPVKGRLTEMDVHLMHRSAEGKMAIVVVRLALERGAPNAVLATLWPHLPTRPGSTARVTEMVDAGGLLPADRGYWTYMGSLTTPPCTEGVRWFVFEQELSISLEQFRAFAALFKVNTRPVQDAHGRRIEANE